MKDLFKQIKQDIEDRQVWEERQATAYKLRMGQIRRRIKPYPHASDLSWPLIDGVIERLKPAYVEQVMGPETICSFISKNKQGEGFTDKVAQWFDYRVKVKSNFTRQIQHVIDTFLNQGKAFLKTYWSIEHECVRHQSIWPTMLIVPPWTEELSEADRACHVMHISKSQYLRVAEQMGYNPDPDFADQISGTGGSRSKAGEMYQMAKDLREGLGWHSRDDIIILWEAYERMPDKTIRVRTFSPMIPDEAVRQPFTLPYNHNNIPVVQYDFEITDVGFYSPRGNAEILALYQSVLKVLLDTDMDYLIHCGRPIWQPADNAPSANFENFEMAPGEVINARLEPLQFPTPPLDFIQRQQNFRSIAEQRVGAPDYGIGDQDQAGQGKKTATEVNQLGTTKESGINLHARIFGESLGQTLKMQWSLELQYKKNDLNYFYKRAYKQIDADALRDIYELEPNGSKDGYSREKQLQKLVQVYQMFNGQPWFNGAAAGKEILENVDADLIKNLYVDLDVSQAHQVEEQADEIGAMINGFNPPVNPEDNDMDHIQAIEAWKQYVLSHPQKNQGPDVVIRVIQHEDAHIGSLKKKQPQAYAAQRQGLDQIEAQNKKTVQQILAMAQQAQAQQAAGSGQVGAPPGAPQAPGGQPPPPSPNGSGPSPAMPGPPLQPAAAPPGAMGGMPDTSGQRLY